MNLFRMPLIVMLALLAVNSAFAGTLTIGNTGGLSTTPGSELLLSGGGLLTTIEGGLVLNEGDIDVSDGNNPGVPDDAYDIYVEGNLFLDYSVFGTDQDLNISGSITLSGETIAIFSPEQEPTIPDLSTVVMFRNPYLWMHETGEVLLFSEAPVLNGVFEATGSLFIGNYSSLTPVPLPPALVLFLSGIAVFGLRREPKNHFNGQPTSKKYTQLR